MAKPSGMAWRHDHSVSKIINNPVWKIQYADLVDELRAHRTSESLLKRELWSAERKLRDTKHDLHKITKERLLLEKKVAKFWTQKRQQIYNKRLWAKEHMGEVLRAIEKSDL